jgi:hypothetical protein
MSAESEIDQYRALEEHVFTAIARGVDDDGFDSLALAIHAFQRRWNGPYAKFCSPQPEAKSWREIPAVPQSVFKRFRLATFPPEETQTLFRTSGTTGERRGEHHFRDTRLYDAAILAGWDRLHLPRAAALAMLAPSPAQNLHSSLSHMLGVLGERRCGTMPAWCVAPDGSLDVPRLRQVIRESGASDRPIGLLGTALAFLNLCERLGTERLHLPPQSFVFETGGFKGSGRDVAKAELYARISDATGLPPPRMLNEYGMTELSSQFYSVGLGMPHTAGSWVRAVVIDPESGREVPVDSPGILRIVDLANLGSVLAIETQDLAVRRLEGFELLGRDPAALPRGCSREADELLRRP